MDKNTITGLVIIFLILIGFSYFTRPSEKKSGKGNARTLSQELNSRKWNWQPGNRKKTYKCHKTKREPLQLLK